MKLEWTMRPIWTGLEWARPIRMTTHGRTTLEWATKPRGTMKPKGATTLEWATRPRWAMRLKGAAAKLGRKFGAVSLVVFLGAGCATPLAAKPKQTDALNLKVASLEGEIRGLSQRVEELALAQEALAEEREAAKTAKAQESAQVRSFASPKLAPRQIQTALANAGFYRGPIDGKLGPRTKKALREFQRSEGLTPDGVVGPKTALALERHLPARGGTRKRE